MYTDKERENKIMKNKIIETIEELKKHLSKAELAYDKLYNDEFEKGVAFGKIEAYEHCINLLNGLIK